ncbi:prolyl oligopeptidase family serine peptidase [Planctomycetota bacterium]
MKRAFVCVSAVFFAQGILFNINAVWADRHSFGVQDMLAMHRISDPQVSPDGNRVLFSVRQTDMEADRGRTDLWSVRIDGSDLHRLTRDPASDFNGRWDPNGQAIWFLSTRSESSQVWRLPIDGGESQQITDLPLDVSNLVVAPDGRHIAFTMEVYPDANALETRARLDAQTAAKASGRIYDRIFVRHWDTWKDGRRSHLFVLPVGQEQPIDLMGPRHGFPGMDADTPAKPFGGSEEITFTPNGQALIFTARVAGPNEPWSTDFDLYQVPLDGSLTPRCLTDSNAAWDTHPLFSPNGKKLAYLAMARAGYESDRFRIVIQDWPAGKARVLTENWDRSPHAFCWSADSQTLYAMATDTGQVPLFAVSAKTGKVRALMGQGAVQSVAVAGSRIVYGLNHLKSPTELYTMRDNGKDVQRLTQLNAPQLNQVKLGDYEQFSFSGWNGEKVHGFVIKPVDFNPEATYPVAFLIHGGPQGSFNNRFHYRWNAQAYAGAGYGAVMVDFHGSTGYGQAFTDSIRGDWGGKPLEDLQKGLAAALEKYPWLDGSRVGALGASFGGYMINWIAGQWPDRFRCLINHDGNLDERMAYYDTEELWFPEWDHLGTPWDNPDAYEKHNPVNYVKNWKTPMLVIHGALDYRVVDTQGLATFNALQRRGIPSRLLYFPDENHWVLRPHNSVLWHETVIGWLDQWVKP